MKSVLILAVSLMLFSCEDKDFTKPILIYKFTDSTYTKVSDSVATNNMYEILEKKTLTGYYKIFDKENFSYGFGQLYKSKSIGKWLSYEKNFKGKYILKAESNFNKKGNLEGSYIMFNDSGKVNYIDSYSNGIINGIQKKFYDSGELLCQYEVDEQSNYINSYIFYLKSGKIMYQENFLESGTGYEKYFDEYGNVIKEGKFVNKKKEGWHKEYHGTMDNQTETLKELFRDDSLIYSSITFYEGYKDQETQKLIDSVVYNLKNKGKAQHSYYYGGKQLKISE